MNGYNRHRVTRDGVDLVAHVQQGEGPLVVLQHGLCGDAAQPAEVFPEGAGFRHAVLDCRGHGQSAVGAVEALSIDTFAADVAAMVAALGSRPLAVGGISMGAAIALRLAVHRPDLVPALILVRPAWVTEAAPANMRPNAEVGALMAEGASVAQFEASATARKLAVEAPDNLASMRGFFDRAPRQVTAALLTRIAADGPGVTRHDLAALKIPVLIAATGDDVIHPLAHAEMLAALIPGAVLTVVPPKGRDRVAHVAALRSSIGLFLRSLR